MNLLLMVLFVVLLIIDINVDDGGKGIVVAPDLTDVMVI